MSTREEVILNLIRRAGSEPILERFIHAIRPRQRNCRMCGTEYVGVRDICESPSCSMAWQELMREHERRHPRMPSSGMTFYLDYLAQQRGPHEDVNR